MLNYVKANSDKPSAESPESNTDLDMEMESPSQIPTTTAKGVPDCVRTKVIMIRK